MTNTELLTLTGIGITFIISVFNLIITFRNVRKTSFINSITSSRIKYIQELRENISRSCALVYSYNNRISELNDEQLWELHKEADTLRFLIKLNIGIIKLWA